MIRDTYKAIIALLLVTGYAGYSIHIYTDLPQASGTVDARVEQGKKLWQSYNCIACHQIYGLGGYLGPDLTNTYSLKGAAYIRAFLESGTNVMPNFNLSNEEMDALTAYMKDIDKTGNAAPSSFKLHLNGTIEQ